MDIIILGFIAIIGLGLLVALSSMFFHKKGEEDTIVENDTNCTTCDGVDPKCEQVCMMEASTKAPEYFDDEELDRFIGRASHEYTDEEAEEFTAIMESMNAEEVPDWNRSLVVRGLNVPDQVKDELFMLLEDNKQP